MNKTKRIKLFIKTNLNATTVPETQVVVEQKKEVISVESVDVKVTLPAEVSSPVVEITVPTVSETTEQSVTSSDKKKFKTKKPVVEIDPVIVTLPEDNTSTSKEQEEVLKEQEV